VEALGIYWGRKEHMLRKISKNCSRIRTGGIGEATKGCGFAGGGLDL
jgi:hypothetical protein